MTGKQPDHTHGRTLPEAGAVYVDSGNVPHTVTGCSKVWVEGKTPKGKFGVNIETFIQNMTPIDEFLKGKLK